MCGIAGLLNPAAAEQGAMRATLSGMSERLVHRGPDNSGLWIDPASGIGFAHRRLSILDLSPVGHQPMHSATGRHVLVLNGEIYNHQELRQALERQGAAPAWRGHSDTESLLAGFDAWGIERSLKRAVGMFALAVWDRNEQTLYLARDRMGEKPLYYGWLSGTLAFASELKALRAVPGFAGEVDRDALALLLRHNYIPSPYSIFRGIRKLPPACIARSTKNGPNWQRRELEIMPYWSLRTVAEQGTADPFRGSEMDATVELEKILRDAIGLQMISDVPLGALLSGGIDSSTVVALMQAQSSRPVRTYSIGFHEAGYDEASHASAVARHLGTEHTDLYVTPREAMEVIPRLPEVYDEPFADSSQIPTILVSQMARRHVTVALSGDGGDELFGGYARYFRANSIARGTRWLPRVARTAAAQTIGAFSTGAWDRAFGLAAAVLPRASRLARPGDRLHKLAGLLSADTTEALYHGLVSHWPDPREVAIDAREPPTVLTDPERWASLSEFHHRLMYLDTVSYLPDDILAKVDRAAMSVSLETRVPLLDHRVVEFAWRLPLGMKIRGNQGKRILRQVLGKHVPEELTSRPKMGFGVPIGDWLREPLREWAEALLDERRLKQEGFLHSAPVRRKWSEHLSGQRNWQYPLWDVLMFQAWLEHQRS
jgi:asparagine synthase (glutamine-hydrolysing)